jgi:hypothetical protein
MLLTVKKHVEETVELKTPAYYKDDLGNFFFINEVGELIKVNPRMILEWGPDDGRFYNESIEELMRRGEPCTKKEFEKAYAQALAKFENAVTVQL